MVISGIFPLNCCAAGTGKPVGTGIISFHQASSQSSEKMGLGILAEKNFRKATVIRIRTEAERLICSRFIGSLHFIDHSF